MKFFCILLKSDQKRVHHVEQNLVKYMEQRGLEEVDGIKYEKIIPKPRKKAKPRKLKEEDGITFFSNLGVPNAIDVWKQFQDTQT